MRCSCEEMPSVPYVDLGLMREVGQVELASLAEASNSASSQIASIVHGHRSCSYSLLLD